jgi:ketosteroid isomerase-like protein
MTLCEANERCLYQHLKAEHAHDLEGTLATLHPEVEFEDQPIGLSLRGRADAARHYRLWWEAFGIQTERGTLHWVGDSLLIADAHFVGTHSGDFLGIAPTGNAVRFPFTVYVGFRDGLLSSERFFYDLNSIMAQIGQNAFKIAA